MDQKSRSEDQQGSATSRSGQRSGKSGKQDTPPKPHWPLGLKLSAKEDITCFIPEGLTVIVSREAFEQLFAYAYSTTTYIALSGNVRRTLASVLAREAWPVALPLASNTVALLRFRLAMVTVTLARTTCQGARPWSTTSKPGAETAPTENSLSRASGRWWKGATSNASPTCRRRR